MKLRNKKTGKIKDVESLGHDRSLKDKYGPQITLSWNTEYENLGECKTYNSLAELNEEWEDYEEPKTFWYIRCSGEVYEDESDACTEHGEKHKQIGNYFETKEEAEKAVEKLKAWKRLKDNGFEFESWFGGSKDISFWIDTEIDENIAKDLDLLFGGEE